MRERCAVVSARVRAFTARREHARVTAMKPSPRFAAKAALVAASLAAACAGSTPVVPSPPRTPPMQAARDLPVVQLGEAATMGELSVALTAVPHAAEPWGLALFGLDDAEPGVSRVRVRIGSVRSVTIALAGTSMTTRWLREDPRAHNGGILGWTPTGLRGSHPSDTSESDPVDFAAMARANQRLSGRPREGVLVLLVTGTEPAGPVIAALEGAAAAVSWVAMPLE
jgi:hypothetical protein